MNFYGNKLVNMIKTKPLCASPSNLADMFTIAGKRMNPIDLEVEGQGHYVHL